MRAALLLFGFLATFALGYAVAPRASTGAADQGSAPALPSSPGGSGDPGPPPLPAPARTAAPDEEDRIQFMRYGMAASEHLQLVGLAGTWDVTCVLTYPGQPTATSAAVATYSTLAEGRFLLEELRGTLAGSQYLAMGIFGFDRMARVYTSVWVDNTGTAMHFAQGERRSDGTLVLRGVKRDHHDHVGRPFRTEISPEAAGVMRKKVYDTIDGQDVLLLEMTYRRKA